MTADDGHYPGPDVGVIASVIVTAAVALLVIWGLAAIVEALL